MIVLFNKTVMIRGLHVLRFRHALPHRHEHTVKHTKQFHHRFIASKLTGSVVWYSFSLSVILYLLLHIFLTSMLTLRNSRYDVQPLQCIFIISYLDWPKQCDAMARYVHQQMIICQHRRSRDYRKDKTWYV